MSSVQQAKAPGMTRTPLWQRQRALDLPPWQPPPRGQKSEGRSSLATGPDAAPRLSPSEDGPLARASRGRRLARRRRVGLAEVVTDLLRAGDGTSLDLLHVDDLGLLVLLLVLHGVLAIHDILHGALPQGPRNTLGGGAAVPYPWHDQGSSTSRFDVSHAGRPRRPSRPTRSTEVPRSARVEPARPGRPASCTSS